MLDIVVVTLFPEFFPGPLQTSILGRAAAKGRVRITVRDLRDWTRDRHQTADDAPYGGGAGMVLKPEPFFEMQDELRRTPPIVLLSARGRPLTHADAVRYSVGAQLTLLCGRPLTHADAVRYSVGTQLTLLCGHYKDVDQRVADHLATEEVSIGDVVLSGGEPAALVVVDAVVRLLPGALGDHESAAGDSHYDGLLAPPSYTRPAEHRGHRVPEVLLSGDHARIEAWRQEEAERLTRERRPDLWTRFRDTTEE